MGLGLSSVELRLALSVVISIGVAISVGVEVVVGPRRNHEGQSFTPKPSEPPSSKTKNAVPQKL